MIARVLFIYSVLSSTVFAEPILGGDYVKNPTKFPYAVKLDIFVSIKQNNRDTSYNCVGVIINPSVVLTVAHCIYDKGVKITRISVTAGTFDLSNVDKSVIRRAKAYKVHENYKETTNNWFKPNEVQANDIAIIWLRGDLVLSDVVQPAKFPTQRIPTDNIIGVSIGWGVEESGYVSNVLKRVNVKTITQNECVKKHRFFISENTFCAVSTDGKSIPSAGDSGCPFVHNKEVLGLYSFGMQLPIKRDNGQEVPSIDPSRPIAYTDVFRYRKWIAKSLESGAPNNPCNYSKKFPRMCALR